MRSRRCTKHGVGVKILTGDNDLISRKVCRDVGLEPDPMLLGEAVEKMSDSELAESAEKTTLFARLTPAHKQRIVRLLRSKGHVVGFMGDGINDAPALHTADIGISVDAAVDIAKESADLILLEKDLMVLEGGVIEGRKVFANILKYIRMGASSNFGNMFSVLGASAFLPFIPMAPIQILTNNMLYDFSQVPIPTDAVDEELVARQRPWDVGEIKRFILCIGPISSIFDYSTFFVMLYLFRCWDPARAPLFQTGWFVESIMTQTLIIHIIRTNKIPFFSEPCELVPDSDNSGYHGPGSVASVLTTGLIAGSGTPAGTLLADSARHTAGLLVPYAGNKSLAAAEEMDLNRYPLFVIRPAAHTSKGKTASSVESENRTIGRRGSRMKVRIGADDPWRWCELLLRVSQRIYGSQPLGLGQTFCSVLLTCRSCFPPILKWLS